MTEEKTIEVPLEPMVDSCMDCGHPFKPGDIAFARTVMMVMEDCRICLPMAEIPDSDGEYCLVCATTSLSISPELMKNALAGIRAHVEATYIPDEKGGD